jgi:DNA mismatch endonuclease (patch repair protein)
MIRNPDKRSSTAGAWRPDPLTPSERSARMSKVRATGNRSTERHVAAHLTRHGLRGWKRHLRTLPGCPDFVFVEERIAVFVDGCFWHGCPRCGRNLPHSRRQFWRDKIESNRRRDQENARLLRYRGYAVVRVWEHSLSDSRWLARLLHVIHSRRSGSPKARARHWPEG